MDAAKLDVGIAPLVLALREAGVETYESCQGGDAHCFPEPTVRFEGGPAEGFRAFGVAVYHGFQVADLRRSWSVVDHELTGPVWELTLRTTER